MSIQIAVNVDPRAPNVPEINAAIALLTALRDGSLFGAGAPSLPGVGIGPDNPAAGMEYPTADQAFGTQPTADQAFAGNASTAVAPHYTASAATSTQAGIEVDKNGMPWNGQIHTETKSKNQDGTWRYRRNTDKALIAQVEAQMRAVMALPAGNAAPAPTAQAALPSPGSLPLPGQPAPAPSASPSASAAPVPNQIPPAPGSVAPAAPNQSQPTPATGAAVPTATASAVPENAFIAFIGRITPLLGDGRLTQPEVEAACAAVGVVGGLPLLSTRPDLVPNVEGMVRSILQQKGVAF